MIISNHRTSFVLRILLLVALAIATASYWLTQDFSRFLQTPLKNETTKSFRYTVKKGASVSSVARDLEYRGLLQKPYYLVLYARFTGLAPQIKAGEYLIPPETTPLGLLQLLVAGRTVQYSLTLIEGWNFKQVMAAVHAHPSLHHSLSKEAKAQTIMAQLGYPDVHPEGRFFPDTYYFPRATSDIEFLQRAYVTMQKKLRAVWQSRRKNLPVSTPEQVLILASIIEKETGQAAERGHIAGVFTHRLHIGMRLQSDPTVIYGMGADFDGDLRKKDLRQNTPYNTYVHGGLPPTPIALPGLEALQAVVNPLVTKDLYFVAKGNGKHHFSASLIEHNRMVQRYQKRRRQIQVTP